MQTTRIRTFFPLSAIVVLLLLLLPLACQARRIACTLSADCRRARPSFGHNDQVATCHDGFCTNPYYEQGGCLRELLPEHRRIRVCHSEDPPEAIAAGHCRRPLSPWDYPEVRIYGQNWASALFTAWVLQILLSELLDVPATLETSLPELRMDFYNREAPYSFSGGSNDWDAVRTATEVGDCRTTTTTRLPTLQSQKEEEEPTAAASTYRPCANIVPEVWQGHEVALRELRREDAIESLTATGALGVSSWYVPRFVGARDPTLLTYLGLQGEHNRHKLAETFLRPTTWKVYCDEISHSTCRQPDAVAQRPPASPEEEERYFAEGLFTGHFRKTEKNDCVKWPQNCTGHIVDYPCSWSSHLPAQTHHLGIALESDGAEGVVRGYTYGQMVELWSAANATKSNLIMVYYTPSLLYQTYARTNAEFTKVNLPPPTQECIRHRTDVAARCDTTTTTTDPSVLWGDPKGSCDQSPHSLDKVVSPSIFRAAAQGTQQVFHSPAYDAIQNFRLSELQVGRMLDAFLVGQTGDPGLDARDAVCAWVRDNLDDVLGNFVPVSYPRLARTANSGQDTLGLVAMAMAATALVATSIVSVVCLQHRENPKIQRGPVDLIAFLLLGLLMISAGALLLSASATSWQCVSVVYLTNLGYVLELVPVIIKIGSIFRRKMDHPREMDDNNNNNNENADASFLLRQRLVRLVSAASLLMLLLLVTWTCHDPPQKLSEFVLTSSLTRSGETIVDEFHYCGGSEGDGWVFFSLSWQLILLFLVSILAYQTRKFQHNTEVTALALLMYSHLTFVFLRGVLHFAQDALGRVDTASLRSLIYSLDALGTLGIYFVPKFFEHERRNRQRGRFMTFNSFRVPYLRLSAVQRRGDPNYSATIIVTQPGNLVDKKEVFVDESILDHPLRRWQEQPKKTARCQDLALQPISEEREDQNSGFTRSSESPRSHCQQALLQQGYFDQEHDSQAITITTLTVETPTDLEIPSSPATSTTCDDSEIASSSSSSF